MAVQEHIKEILPVPAVVTTDELCAQGLHQIDLDEIGDAYCPACGRDLM